MILRITGLIWLHMLVGGWGDSLSYTLMGTADLIAAPEISENDTVSIRPAIYSLFVDDRNSSRILAGTESALLEISHQFTRRRTDTFSVVFGQLGSVGITFDKNPQIGRVTGIARLEEEQYILSDSIYHFLRRINLMSGGSEVAIGQPGEAGFTDGKLNTPGDLLPYREGQLLIVCRDALHTFSTETGNLTTILHSPTNPGFTDLVINCGVLYDHSVVLGIEAVSDDNGALTMLFLEFNLLSNQSSISVVHYANSIIKSMTKIDEQSLAIANSGQSLSGMYFGHKEEVTMHWTAPLQMVYDFNEATDHSAMGRIDGLSVAAAGNFIYVGHTMGLITYAFGVRFHPETPFEGSCGDEVFTVLNQEAVPYAMASILAETMNAPLFKLPATTEPQKSHSVIKLLNGSREETILQTGVWLDKYQYEAANTGVLNNLALQEEPQPKIWMPEKMEAGDKAKMIVESRDVVHHWSDWSYWMVSETCEDSSVRKHREKRRCVEHEHSLTCVPIASCPTDEADAGIKTLVSQGKPAFMSLPVSPTQEATILNDGTNSGPRLSRQSVALLAKNGAWWMVDLEQSYIISHVSLESEAMYLAPESYKLRMHPGSELLVNPNPMEDGWVQHSANHGGYFALEFTFNLLNHKAYRYIAVIRWDSENFNLTGVKVYAQDFPFVTDNIALNKPTEQSGTFQKEDGTRYGSEKANNGDLSDFSLSLRGINSWWLVDLQSQHYVMGILIHNMRTMENPDGADSLMQWTGEGRNYHRLRGFSILSSMNRVYDPNTSPNGGWTVRVKRHGIKNVGAVYKKSFTSFPARFLAILVDYHLGVGLNEVQVIGKEAKMTNISDVIATNSPFIQIRETSCCDVIENIPEGWDLSIPLSYKAARLQSQDLASVANADSVTIVLCKDDYRNPDGSVRGYLMCQADGTWLIQTKPEGTHHIQLSGSDIYKELCSVKEGTIPPPQADECRLQSLEARGLTPMPRQHGRMSQTIQVYCSGENQQLRPDEQGRTPDSLTAICEDYQMVHQNHQSTTEAKTWNLGYYNQFPAEELLCITPVGCPARWLRDKGLTTSRSTINNPKIYYPGDEVSVTCQSPALQFIGKHGEIFPKQFIIVCSDNPVYPAWSFNDVTLPRSAACLHEPDSLNGCPGNQFSNRGAAITNSSTAKDLYQEYEQVTITCAVKGYKFRYGNTRVAFGDTAQIQCFSGGWRALNWVFPTTGPLCIEATTVTTTRPTEVIPIQMANRCTDAEARRRGLMFSALMPSKAVLPGSQAVLHCITPGHGIVPNNKGHIIPDGKPLLSVCLSPAGSTPYFSYEDQYPRNDPLCQASPEEQGFFYTQTSFVIGVVLGLMAIGTVVIVAATVQFVSILRGNRNRVAPIALVASHRYNAGPF